MNEPTFSVLICTYNRPEMLRMALAALIERTDEKPDQVVVVNGGDARSDAIMEAYCHHPAIEVKLTKTENINLATSRNIGLAHCTGDIVAMTDDDAEVFPDWVSQMKRAHAQHPEAGAVGGAVLGAESHASFLSRLADVVTFPSSLHVSVVRTLPGVNISYKKNVLDKIGQQDVNLFRGEDVDYNWRVKELGFDILYDPSIKVKHHHRPSLCKFWHQNYMYGRAYYRVRKKWPEMYCVYPHQIKTAKDLLKLGYFFVAIIYEPITFALRMPGLVDNVFALPVLFINQIAWKFGMLQQAIIDR